MSFNFQFENRLKEFGINANSDIIAATGDGASVMISFGKKAPFEYITCLNHSINLAVLEVIFPKKEEQSGDSEIDDEADELDQVHALEETFHSTVSKMRAIIKFFRKSPVKNSYLQAELERQSRKQLELIMFTKTRWNSLVMSGKRFLELLPAVLVTISELGNSLSWDDANTTILTVSFFSNIQSIIELTVFIEKLQNLIEVLEPALIATEALSKDSINILEGEFIIESLANQTEKLNSPVGENFSKILIAKLNQRRNTEVTSLALYLLNQQSLKSTSSYPFKLASKSSTQQLGSKLLERLFETSNDTSTAEDESSDEQEEEFRDIIKKNIADRWKKGSQKGSKAENTNVVQKDFRFYEQHQQKSPLLEKLFQSLCSIPPTSTQSERNFSLSGNFVTKLRSRLTPEHVDILCFLKSYFLNVNQ